MCAASPRRTPSARVPIFLERHLVKTQLDNTFLVGLYSYAQVPRPLECLAAAEEAGFDTVRLADLLLARTIYGTRGMNPRVRATLRKFDALTAKVNRERAAHDPPLTSGMLALFHPNLVKAN
jgi:hypothetical protein